MSEQERTIMACDDQGREGHSVSYLGGGEFSVTLPGEEEAIFRTDDPDYV